MRFAVCDSSTSCSRVRLKIRFEDVDRSRIGGEKGAGEYIIGWADFGSFHERILWRLGFGTWKEGVVALGMVDRGCFGFRRESLGVWEKRYVFRNSMFEKGRGKYGIEPSYPSKLVTLLTLFWNIAGTGPIEEIWNPSDISHENLPEVDSLLFGMFQVVDKKVKEPDTGLSYIDYAFGSTEQSFAGVHRFSVERRSDPETVGVVERKTDDTDYDDVRVTFSCIVCDPKAGKRLSPQWIREFHGMYAGILFREGIAQILI
jgi:hypothetical protein